MDNRKKRWFSNLLLRMITNNKKNKNIWIFGAWKGNYKDNAKTLFEYCSINCPEIKCYFFVNNKIDYDFIVANNMNAVLINSIEAKRISRVAGVCFYTNGLDDFGEKIYCYNSYKVSLWHGVGYKGIYLTDIRYKDSLLKKIYRLLFSYVARNLTIATSKFIAEHFVKSFGLKKNSNIFITGQPRNEILLKSKPSNRIISYLPTYRKNNKFNYVIQDFIDYFNTESGIDFLSNNNFIIKYKLHPLSKGINTKSNKFFMETKEDTQVLLCESNTVITDYSSVIMDFAITGRQTIIFAPDYNEFMKNDGMIEEAKELYNLNTISFNIEDLKLQLINGDSLSPLINKIFNIDCDGNYSKKIVSYLRKAINI